MSRTATLYSIGFLACLMSTIDCIKVGFSMESLTGIVMYGIFTGMWAFWAQEFLTLFIMELKRK